MFSSVSVGRCAISTVDSFRQGVRYMTPASYEDLELWRERGAGRVGPSGHYRDQRVRCWVSTGAQAPYSTDGGVLDAATLRGAASVVRLGRHVVDAADLEARGLERADRRLATRARALHEDVDLLHAVLLRLARSGLGSELRGERGRLARALEAHAARGRPADHGTVGVGDRDDRVVERRLDVGLAHGDVLLFLLARLASSRLGCCHV